MLGERETAAYLLDYYSRDLHPHRGHRTIQTTRYLVYLTWSRVLVLILLLVYCSLLLK